MNSLNTTSDTPSFINRFLIIVALVTLILSTCSSNILQILFGYYNWDSILYTHKIITNDIKAFASFGRILQYEVGYIFSESFSFILKDKVPLHIILAATSSVSIILLINIAFHILRARTWIEYCSLFILLISLPSIIFIGTTVLSEGFVLTTTFASLLFHLQWLKCGKSKYLIMIGLTICATAGFREYFIVVAITLLLHNLILRRITSAYLMMIIGSVVFSIAVFYLLLPSIYGTSYGATRFKYISNIVDSDNKILERTISLYNAVTYNVSLTVLLAVGLGLSFARKNITMWNVRLLLLLLFVLSTLVLCVYGDALSMRRYVVFALIPLVVMMFDMFRSVTIPWIRFLLVTIFMLHIATNIPHYKGMWEHKKYLVLFASESKNIMQKKSASVVIVNKSTIEYALLKYNLNALGEYDIAFLDKPEQLDTFKNLSAKFIGVKENNSFDSEYFFKSTKRYKLVPLKYSDNLSSGFEKTLK